MSCHDGESRMHLDGLMGNVRERLGLEMVKPSGQKLPREGTRGERTVADGGQAVTIKLSFRLQCRNLIGTPVQVPALHI